MSNAKPRAHHWAAAGIALENIAGAKACHGGPQVLPTGTGGCYSTQHYPYTAPQAFREEGRALDHHSYCTCHPKATSFVDACGFGVDLWGRGRCLT